MVWSINNIADNTTSMNMFTWTAEDNQQYRLEKGLLTEKQKEKL